MKAVYFTLTALLLLSGCKDTYRYPCQDPENKDNPQCNRPACEAEGYCYDILNGLPPPQPETEVDAAPPAADCDCETKGE